MSYFETKGKLAVISGGSQGLGAALAKQLILKGSNVVIVSRTESKLQKTVTSLELSRLNDDQLIKYIVADVSDPTECSRVFQELDDVPDIVICCAGGAVPGLLVDMEADTLKKHMAICYDTALFFSHAAMKVMIPKQKEIEAHHGRPSKRHLIYCSSVLALFPFIGYGSYGPAKAAIRALADIARQECIPYNISVANILPGNMATEGFVEEEKTKPEITRKIEGPSDARDPDIVAKEVIRDLERGQEMIYTDLIGWILSGLMMGASPRNWGIFQSIIAAVLVFFAPVWMFFVRKDIKDYFQKKTEEEHISKTKTEQTSNSK
ncbi:3-dehydrosphinganine reductase [Sugiyamaella lignohabitans]|uniref:3-ketodihydrosphingosine reductase TSC10 n=1 Tax=Sugiyamaella lignohabitans TaxID=796027 RepID=A0A161HHA5_9ASCO|nr:3-dehydrosphinganine reductase [Sugiyamaella lignohabitans]ANB15350.1 3-dehydrosphinganine reductase [Sugiyamaella lignohabitans]